MATDLDRSDRPHRNDLLTPGQAAALFNVTPKTVGRWDESGILPAERTNGGHRRFHAKRVYDLLEFLQEVGEP